MTKAKTTKTEKVMSDRELHKYQRQWRRDHPSSGVKVNAKWLRDFIDSVKAARASQSLFRRVENSVPENVVEVDIASGHWDRGEDSAS